MQQKSITRHAGGKRTVQLPTCNFMKLKPQLLALKLGFCNEAFSVFDYVALKH
jgi:hypothetical protein